MRGVRADPFTPIVYVHVTWDDLFSNSKVATADVPRTLVLSLCGLRRSHPVVTSPDVLVLTRKGERSLATPYWS